MIAIKKRSCELFVDVKSTKLMKHVKLGYSLAIEKQAPAVGFPTCETISPSVPNPKRHSKTRDMPAPGSTTHKLNPPMCCHINNLSRREKIIETADERRLLVFVPS